MRLLLLVTMTAVVVTTTASYAHENDAYMSSVYQTPTDSLSNDSLQMLYQHIDLLTVFDLQKWRESFIYKNRTQPSYQNKQILIYIEERLKVVK
jgi:hypothetical protein